MQSVTLHTNLGDLKIEVFCDEVPKTAMNFMALCASRYYDKTIFHRNIKGKFKFKGPFFPSIMVSSFVLMHSQHTISLSIPSYLLSRSSLYRESFFRECKVPIQHSHVISLIER